MIEFIVDNEYEGVRLDRYLRKKIPGLFLSDIYKMIRKGKVKVNNKKVKQDTRLIINNKIQVYVSENFSNKLKEEDKKEETFIVLSEERKNILSKMVLFENSNLFIINKNSGEIIHRGSGHDISLLEEYRSYFKNNSVNFVNRIDKATSGIVIASKNIRTARKIAEYIRNKKIEKKYYILTYGCIQEKEFKIENYLKKFDEKVKISNIKEEGFKKSISFFKKISSSKNYTLLEGTLETGRTHQLRVQLANIGHPIVGDLKYGKINKNLEEPMFLFSHFLKISNENIEINLDVPKLFIDKLKK